MSAFFNGLFAFFLVYYVYLRNKKNPLNRSFLYFGIAVSGWSLIYSLWCLADNAKTAEMLGRFFMMFATLIPATFFHFVSHFTQSYAKQEKLSIFLYLLGFFYSVACLTPAMIQGVRPAMFFPYWAISGILLPSHVVYFGFVVAYSFFLIAKKLFETSGADRIPVLWVLIAFLIGFGGGSTNWFLWFDIQIPPLTNFFVGITFGMIAYAIVRYGLMDTDVLVDALRASRTAALGLVASSINHELRNPLYIAKGRIETQIDAVERGVFNSPAEEIAKSRSVMQTVLAQLTRAMDIMQRFSDFARPNPPNSKKEKVVVREVFQDVLKFVGNDFEFKKIKLVESPMNGTSVCANRRQLEEIFFNLIINACHAMGEGGGELALRASQPNGKVIIEVEDSGPGIPKENLRRIFEPFYTTKAEKGSGLGLYITKQLVEKNGGKISVKSNPGQGTKFILEFQPS